MEGGVNAVSATNDLGGWSLTLLPIRWKPAVHVPRAAGALINGLTEGRFLDDASFVPILTRAEALEVPIYIHPGIPPERPVRKAYYAGLPGHFSFMLAIVGWGWHAETAVHVLRLILSGTLDRTGACN